jgi:hypothetical protein
MFLLRNAASLTIAATLAVFVSGCTEEVEVAHGEQDVHDMNGCSIPKNLQWLDVHGYGSDCSADNAGPGCALFVAGCNAHDNCYQHQWQFDSRDPATVRLQCDESLHTTHMAACRARFDTSGTAPDPDALSDCFFAAQEVVLAVNSGGDQFFHTDPYTSMLGAELPCAPKALNATTYDHVANWEVYDPYCAPNPCVDPGWRYGGYSYSTQGDAETVMYNLEPSSSNLVFQGTTANGYENDGGTQLTSYLYKHRRLPDAFAAVATFPPAPTWYHRATYLNGSEPLGLQYYNPNGNEANFWGWPEGSDPDGTRQFVCNVAAAQYAYARQWGGWETCTISNFQVRDGNLATWTRYYSSGAITTIKATAVTGKICTHDFACTTTSTGAVEYGHREAPLFNSRFELKQCPPDWSIDMDMTITSKRGVQTQTLPGTAKCQPPSSGTTTISRRTCPKVPRRCGPGQWQGWFEAGEALPASNMCWYGGKQVEVR